MNAKAVLTEKQVEIMRLIRQRNADGTAIDITQLVESLPYKASKQAVLCSVNHLVERELIERMAQEMRHSRKRTPLALTEQGEVWLKAYDPTELKRTLIEDEYDVLLDDIFAS